MAGEFVHDTIMDGAFGVVSGATGLALHLTSAAETTRAGVITDSLASVALTGGDFTLADGDGPGRKQILAAQTGIDIDTRRHRNPCVCDRRHQLSHLPAVNLVASARRYGDGRYLRFGPRNSRRNGDLNMKVEILSNALKHDGQVYEKGDVTNFPDEVGAAFCAAGLVADTSGKVKTGERKGGATRVSFESLKQKLKSA